jgi:hypothetical protein
MIDAALRAALAAFDDAALATLANPGLVRRARRDVEEGKVRIVASQTGKADVEADGQLVGIDTRGPRFATCACKAAAVCRHRIAAVMLLQIATYDIAPAPESAAAEPDLDPQQIIEAIALKPLEKWAGKAAWRAAFDLIDNAGAVEGSAQAVTVAFTGLDDPVRILRGQGTEGIVSKAAKGLQKAWHTAAVLAARRHYGLDLPEPEAQPTSAEPEAQATLSVDPAFVAQVDSALAECVALAFNLAPVPLEESLFLLSVSSRADKLPRLAALLRAVAAEVRLKRQRSLAFDPDHMLELLASAHALTRLLARDDGDAERRAVLAGSLRRDYLPSEPLRLIGVGGERWRSVAGARGVTAWFFDPMAKRFLSVSNARGPGQDPNFSPQEAWSVYAHWQSKPLNILAHARIDLIGAGVTADRRLSSPASASARIVDEKVRPYADWDVVIDDWSELPSLFRASTGIGLDMISAPVVCLIAPQDNGAPFFDDLAQQLVWPVRDSHGSWLALTLDHDALGSPAIEALEAAVRNGWQGTALVRLERRGDGIAVTPVTLFGPGDALDLSFGWPRGNGSAAAQGKSIRDLIATWRGKPQPRFARSPPGATTAAMASAWRLLLDRAEVGRAEGTAIDARLAQQAERIEAMGLPTLAAVLRATRDGGGHLTAAYALMLVRQQRLGLPLLA